MEKLLVEVVAFSIVGALIGLIGFAIRFLSKKNPEVPDQRRTETETSPEEAPPDRLVVGIGGWLAFFCTFLIVLNPLLTILGFFMAHKSIEAVRALDPEEAQTWESLTSITAPWSFSLAILGVVAGILLLFRTRNAVIVAKIYTAAVPTLTFFTFGAVFFALKATDLRGGILEGALQEMIKSLCFFAIWFTYLCRSQRVRNTYRDDLLIANDKNETRGREHPTSSKDILRSH